MAANLLTGVRLLIVAPAALAFAGWAPRAVMLPAVFLVVAIATDYYDGVVARTRGTVSAAGQLFDHATDFLFVTACLAGAATSGLVTVVLPPLIVIAFTQYVVDSYLLHRARRLRMSRLGRWNGILYFVPLVMVALARLPVPSEVGGALLVVAGGVGWLLVLSTAASIVDRAMAVHTSRRSALDPR
jgi:CDP-diacylglycerol--glycerol-3-phosphate 3-phosphatidyltransferase